ncbi:MAG: hypothetical protein KVP17_002275 [Porospora cf. gigantea B]|uniref:uncharacterized protein n=1 Tax=Porospora cf. gigantea B TaxID=2853592 RepID=UPI003571E9DE|nr:MAG: hypothetical protein KVP17_002275 [Porospora cf. gigantea B]
MLRLGGAKKNVAAGQAGSRSPAEIRLQQEFDRLDLPKECRFGFPNPDDLMHFNVFITPTRGYWAGCSYMFSFEIPMGYPFSTPKVKCQTKIWHPNIDIQGNICLNILRDAWTPVMSFDAIIFGLILLMDDPNPQDPLNHDAAAMLRNDPNEFKMVVKSTLRGRSHAEEEFPRLI